MDKFLEYIGWKKYGKWDTTEIFIDLTIILLSGTVVYMIILNKIGG